MTAYDEQTALIVVDVQNDFADPAGSLYVDGGDQVVEAVNAEVEDATAAGAVIVYTLDWHPPVTPHFAKDGGIWPVHCVAGTWGSELHPRLVVAPGGEQVRTGVGGEDGYSGFTVREPVSGEQHATALDDILRRKGIQRVVVTGLATDYCVKETALDALRLGYETTLLTRAVAAVNRAAGDGDRALEEVAAAGASLA
ncbi:MAG: isochorismatase family protein [Acidimicrobiales bacterium]